MSGEYSFYIEKLPEGSRIEKLSNELKNFTIYDIDNLHVFLLNLFKKCHKFVLENIEPIFSPQIELQLIYRTELYQKIEKQKEKNAIVKEQAKRKARGFYIGNSSKGQIFVMQTNIYLC